MGAIMGKGGATVAELRRTTGANIKILSDLGVAGQACERVHIAGEPGAVRAALEAVSSKLRMSQAKAPVSSSTACPAGRDDLPVQQHIQQGPGQGTCCQEVTCALAMRLPPST